MKKEEIKCPECGSKEWHLNAFHNSAPIEEQFMYTCTRCQEQFNMTDSEILYGFQCQECFIQSGEVSNNPNDAPSCCEGKKMAAYRIPLIPLKNIEPIRREICKY